MMQAILRDADNLVCGFSRRVDRPTADWRPPLLARPCKQDCLRHVSCLRQRLICAAMFSGDGCTSRYGHRDVLGVFQRKFPQLQRDLLDAESFQQMRGQPIGKCLDQICRLIAHKMLRFLSNNRIIDRVVDLVGHIALLVKWPERNANR